MRPLLIRLDRRYLKDTYSIGKIYIDGVYFGDSLEDRDRGLYAFQDDSYIKENKGRKDYFYKAIIFILSDKCH